MMSFFVKAKYPTPIFNRADISFTLGLYDGQLFLDQQYLFRPLEMIALTGSIFKVINSDGYIYEVTTDVYPSTCRLYIDCRFVEKTKPKISIHILNHLSKPQNHQQQQYSLTTLVQKITKILFKIQKNLHPMKKFKMLAFQ